MKISPSFLAISVFRCGFVVVHHAEQFFVKKKKKFEANPANAKDSMSEPQINS